MNQTRPFVFNGMFYYVGSIVKIKEEWQKNFKFNTTLQFSGYIEDERIYVFSPIQDRWTMYKLSIEQISQYIERVLNSNTEYNNSINNKMVAPQYIDGIVSAWIWYILIMLFAFFFQGVENKIMAWSIATFIFFNWRNSKIKGG